MKYALKYVLRNLHLNWNAILIKQKLKIDLWYANVYWIISLIIIICCRLKIPQRRLVNLTIFPKWRNLNWPKKNTQKEMVGHKKYFGWKLDNAFYNLLASLHIRQIELAYCNLVPSAQFESLITNLYILYISKSTCNVYM